MVAPAIAAPTWATFLYLPAEDRWSWSAEMPTIFGVPDDEVASLLRPYAEQVEPASDAAGSPMREVQRPGGGVRQVQVQRRTLSLDGRDLVVGVLVDVTDWLAADSHAQQREKLLLAAQEASRMGTFRWNAETDVGEWSPEMYRIFGYEEGLVPSSQAFFARVHPDDNAKFMEAMTAALAGDIRPVEGRIVRPNGEVAHVLISGTLITHEGGRTLLGTVIDMTERRELERQLTHAQKMEAVGTLAGGLAHDFNNYLSVVVNNLPLLRESLGTAPDALEALNDIERASERCRVLTQRLLAFGRKQQHKPRDVDVCWLVESLRGMLDRLVGDHISVKTKTPSSPLCIHVDPNQLEQVIVNLVVNARDAMDAGGAVTVAVDNAVVDAEHAVRQPELSTGEHVKVTVTDSGTGVPAEVRERIFEPFFTTKDSGTGLGLSTVHGIVAESGGVVTMQTSDRGTTFMAFFPRSFPDRVPASPRASRTEQMGGSETILLVEDQPEVRRAARRTLVRAGYTVIERETAEEALAVWEQGEPRVDLLLSDVQLPGMSGVALAECLRGDEPDVAVVLMTGYAPEEVLRSADAPKFTILQKPLGVDELLDALRTALGRA